MTFKTTKKQNNKIYWLLSNGVACFLLTFSPLISVIWLHSPVRALLTVGINSSAIQALHDPYSLPSQKERDRLSPISYINLLKRSIKGCHWQPSGQSKCSTGGWAVGQASHSRMGASGELSGECSDRHEIHRQKRFEIGMTSYIPQYKFIVLYYSKTSI